MKKKVSFFVVVLMLALLVSNRMQAQVFTGSSGASIGAIADSATTSFPLTVSGVGVINNSYGLESLTLNLDHSFSKDLTIYLKSPDGTMARLFQNREVGNFVNTIFIETATQSISTVVGYSTITGKFKPEDPLGQVNNGKSANGVWKLIVIDSYGGDTGIVKNWSIKFSNTPAPYTYVPFKPLCTSFNKASASCSDAPLICNFTGLCGNTSADYSPTHTWAALTNAFCGSIDNNSFVKFVAGASTVKFNVWVYNSFFDASSATPNVPGSGGGGIQIFVYEGSCNSGLISSKYCNNQLLPSNASAAITVSGLVPGNTYYIMFDGFAGDVCNYTIAPESGVSFFDVNISPSSSKVCQNEIVSLATSSIGIDSFLWSGSYSPSGLDKNVSYSGDTVKINTSVLPLGTYVYTITGVGLPSGCGNVFYDTIQVVAPPSIAKQPYPNNQNVLKGFGNIVSPIKISTANKQATFQWYSNTTNNTTGGKLIVGATDSVYIPPNSTNGVYYYYCVVSSGTCTPLTSDIAKVTVTTAAACTAPDALGFFTQPEKTNQGSLMKAVKVVAYCKATGQFGIKTGTVTLKAVGNACGFVAQNKTFISGFATFDSIIFTRGVQNNIKLTASATGFSSALSDSFDIIEPKDTIATTMIKQDDFSPTAPKPWTPVNYGPVVYINSSSTTGTDVSGVVNLKGNYFLRKSFSINSANGGKTSVNTFTFDNVTGLNAYDSLTFEFKVASLDQSGLASISSGGSGADVDENLIVETSLNDGTTWQTLVTQSGGNNKLFPFKATPVTNLTLGQNKLCAVNDSSSAFKVNLPVGITQFKFRVIATNNRINELWAIDDITLIGKKMVKANRTSLPSIVTKDTTVAAGSSIQLSAVVSNATSPIVYAWSPKSLLDDSTKSNPTTITLDSTKTFTLKITDKENCTATSSPLLVKVGSTSILNTLVGRFYHPKGYPISRVDVQFNGFKRTISDTAGHYSLALSPDTSYLIRPIKNNDIIKTNGVSVIDVIQIQGYILKKFLFNSPYKILASDVNKNGSVTALDLLLLKRLVLNIDSSFSGGLWGFTDSSFTITDSLNPFPNKDSIIISGADTAHLKQSFIAYKLGDVTWDWNPATLGTSKQTQPVQLYHEDIKVGKYQSRIIVPIRVRNFRQLLGGQFTLHFNPEALRLVGVEKGLSSLEYGINHAAAGNISFLWANPQLVGETLADGSLLVNLILEKKQDFESESLTITSDITPVEAYDSDMRLHSMEKTSGRLVSAEPLPIAWNISPNPSTGKTVLQYNASESALLTCRLMTTTGKTVFTQRLTANAGNNQWPLNFNQSGKLAAGVYYLKVEGLATGVEMKKVVIQ